MGIHHCVGKSGEKLILPEAAVKAESKLIEVCLQMLLAQAMIGAQDERLHVGNQRMDPPQISIPFFKDLKMMFKVLPCCPKALQSIRIHVGTWLK